MRLFKWLRAGSLFFLIIGCAEEIKYSNPEEILSTFEVAEGFQVELLAMEPLISDPVAMEIDEQGRLYVVEMHGYPLDKSGSGMVKLLTDTDGDGVMDHSVTFADNLKFPTGVLRWKLGILVTDPPNVLYFEDTNGDGKADIRDTLLTGFAVSNPQHNFNTPILGIDNWIYISNEPAVTAKVYKEEFSDLGSEVRFYNKSEGPVLKQNAGGQRIRMKPDQAKLETTSSRGQFGQTYDPWGHHFLVSNANHIFQEVIQASYLNRNPDLLISHSTDNISDHGNAAAVYPITIDPEHQLLTDLGVFTSACGNVFYSGGLFPEEYNNTIFVAEPVSNITHVDKIEGKGAAFRASRMEEKKEFFASRDAWSRPVNHYIGPDGALYVVDYYRRVIEHPEWMGEDAAKSGTLYDGRDQGRIFRITPKGTPPAQWPTKLDLETASDEELIKFLGSANSWFRRNGQRLLLERNNKSSIPILEKMVRQDTSEYGRLHAAWTLEGMEALRPEVVLLLLKDPVAGVRENGVLLSEAFLEVPEILDALTDLQSDENARVRFQLLCTLGDIDSPSVNAARNNLLVADIQDPWFQIAALSARSPETEKLLEECIVRFSRDPEAYQEMIKRIVALLAVRNDEKNIQRLIRRSLRRTDRENADLPGAILAGLVQGSRNVNFKSATYEEERELLLNFVLDSSVPSSVRGPALTLLGYTGMPEGETTKTILNRAGKIARDTSIDETDRLYSIRLLALSGSDDYYILFQDLMIPAESTNIQRAAMQAMHRLRGQDFLRSIVKDWNGLSPGLRDEGIRMLLSGEESIRLLISALENGTIDPSAVQWPQQVGMMAQADDELRRRSRDIFSSEETDEEKKKLLDEYRRAVEKDGDPGRGLEVFKAQCSICHQVGGEYGVAYGPDLATIQNRSKQSILKDILDPGLSITDGYDLWEVTLKNGETRQGIVGSETSTSINLRMLGQEDEVISRSDIESIRAKNISVMPTGLNHLINVEEMTDLLAFIKKM